MGSKAAISNYVKAYRNLIQYPTIDSAKIFTPSSDLIEIKSVWNQKNLELGEITKFRKHHTIQASSLKLLHETTPDDISSQEMSSTSKSEKFHCIVRKTKQDGKKKQYLEVWTQSGLFKNFDVSSFDIHGDIYCDGEFGTLEWSPNEDKILYVAEKKIKDSEPFYKQKFEDQIPLQDSSLPSVGDKYLYKPDWGEQLVDKHQPVACVCDLNEEKLKVLDGIPPNYSVAQLFWSKDGSGIYGVALENEPRRLGLIYCSNRLGYVFHLSLKGEFKILSEKHKSVRSPRLTLDGKSLFWLQRPVGGPHGGCQELIKFDLATNKSETKIGVVPLPGQTFSGLYLHNLPYRCFSNDGNKIFFSSCQKLRTSSYYLDLETKAVHLIPTGDGSATILDVHKDLVLISAGSLQKPPALKIAKLSNFEWMTLTKSEIICKNSVVKEMEFESKGSTFSKYLELGHNCKLKILPSGLHSPLITAYYNALYYGPPQPSSGQKMPLIVYPHGGPHSASVNDYSFDLNFFVSLGYGVLMVNYRGSTGAGENGVRFLMGKVGDTDVKDNHEAVLKVLKDIPYLDQKNVYLNGRSHGGFLVEHLSAQYPDFYRAVCAGNAVVDISGMYTMSDIPDWATTEAGYSFDESKPLTLEQLNKMVTCSPIHLADKIKAPTLILVGKKDLRVPFYEGIKMYNVLKARKVKTRLNLYDDNHTLGSIPNHIDCVINTAIWFDENKA